MGFRRLLKDAATGMYYSGDGGWTQISAGAYDFPDTATAVQTAIKLGKKDLHLVLGFADSRMDVSHFLGDIQMRSQFGNSGLSATLLMAEFAPAAWMMLRMITR